MTDEQAVVRAVLAGVWHEDPLEVARAAIRTLKARGYRKVYTEGFTIELTAGQDLPSKKRRGKR